ncbi:hypothetical protein AVEN_176427-1 [Araneus ventricosus]|uniref:Uncharacterized protein n=1 Tax=Araneus ventricosus TaxID=182803 RepID=A0A4Y2C744_ARAVE|nr:hypothetical protein AVEN_176427-1 [Araneus ventricosus]
MTEEYVLRLQKSLTQLKEKKNGKMSGIKLGEYLTEDDDHLMVFEGVTEEVHFVSDFCPKWKMLMKKMVMIQIHRNLYRHPFIDFNRGRAPSGKIFVPNSRKGVFNKQINKYMVKIRYQFHYTFPPYSKSCPPRWADTTATPVFNQFSPSGEFFEAFHQKLMIISCIILYANLFS